MADKNKVEAIKKQVTIPDYFEEVIVPEMPDYYNDYTVDFDSKPVVKCPIHGEDTPSLRYYEETNTFYCFGCQAAGDVINLHRKFMETINGTLPSFDDAVEFIYNYFIKNIKSTSSPNTKVSEKEEEQLKSSIAEVLVFSNYIKNLEKQLQMDEQLTPKKKKKIYETIDSVTILLSNNMANATEATRHIKNEVRQALT